ncbi:hypothetical protein DUNSADRAFT_18048 [Dunaliella salina]|uniref:Encoded protein n=1 Tax=Dunaliella salina TaxID=3046 RepID=A0ABQ7GZG8_DUNSA|nr:hypothetical protein DUNSADRAFT_18048 [Dunaliella salina]|eukprot:KAF5840011.1 hypothetical protein DUNSADRAFT_18048 [Dunaliella salina]
MEAPPPKFRAAGCSARPGWLGPSWVLRINTAPFGAASPVLSQTCAGCIFCFIAFARQTSRSKSPGDVPK